MSMSHELKKLTDWFEWQVGTKESGVNNVIYNTHYYGTEVSGSQFPWCCAFIWDGFHQTGLSALFCGGEKTAYCPYVVGWARARGRWVTEGYRPGDLLLYDWDGDGVADHIGFCLSFNGEYAEAIEGNSNNAVERTLRPRSAILGAYRPEYPEAAEDKGTEAEDEIYEVRDGDFLWDIAVKMYGDPLRFVDIQKANGLPGTVIHPGDLLIIPRGEEKRTLTVRVSEKTALRLEELAAARNLGLGALLDELAKEM